MYRVHQGEPPVSSALADKRKQQMRAVHGARSLGSSLAAHTVGA
jgi:hypothetical protein